jgi:hypothetical protein
MDALAGFLREAVSRHFMLGEWDCGLFCADWVRVRRGVDPAAAWRGRYHSALGLARLLNRRGGIVAHFDACLINATRTTDPQRGDIAIVETPQGLTGGIVVNSSAVALVGDAIIIRNRSIAPLVAAWSI